MNSKHRCSEEKWLELHNKYMSAPENERWKVLTMEEVYLYYNLANTPKEFQIDKRAYKIIK